MAETVTIGDTDVEIRETADGFEATAVEDGLFDVVDMTLDADDALARDVYEALDEADVSVDRLGRDSAQGGICVYLDTDIGEVPSNLATELKGNGLAIYAIRSGENFWVNRISDL